MKKILLVLVMVAGTVFMGQPAMAAEGDEPVDQTTVSSQTAAEPDESVPASDESSTEAAPADEAVPEPAEESRPDAELPAPAPADEPSASKSAEKSDAAPSDKPAAAKADDKQPAVDDDAAVTAAAAGGAGGPAAAAAPAKVFVCKYVGKPGVDERLKAGKNPISVSSSSTGGAAVGNFFADGQDRSYVIAIDNGQADPDVSLCPRAAAITTVTPVAPTVSPATCFAPGALTVANTPGVTYAVSPVFNGPGNYTVSATALPGFVLSPAVTLPFAATVDAQLTNCPPPPVNPKKVYICKYVGTPGVDERLQTGGNPIEVSVNALPGAPTNPAVGDMFNDAQGRSVVIALSPANPVPTIADCLAPVAPKTDVTAAAPTVDPATCLADGVLKLPTTSGITYTQNPQGSGPGAYTVTAAADAAFNLVGQSSFPVVVQPRLTGVVCTGGGGGTTDPGAGSGTNDPGAGNGDDDGGSGDTPIVFTKTPLGMLPNTGGTPLWMLLLGGSLTAAGVIILMANRRVVHAYSSGSAPLYSLGLPPMRVAPVATASAVTIGGLRGVLASVVAGVRRLMGRRA